MRLSALGVLLLAAVFHSTWNLLLKREPNRLTLIAGACIWTSLGAVVLFLYEGRLPPGSLVPAVASGILNLLNFVALSEAYERTDFSIAYPIARGGAPALLALGAVVVLREQVSALGVTGIAIVVAGLALVGSARRSQDPTRSEPHRRGGIPLAILCAVFIATYSLIDAAAVRKVPALEYVLEIFVVNTLLLVPYVMWRNRPAVFVQAFRAQWKRMLLVSALWLAGYVMVLRVYATNPVAYAGAVREVSIVIGALAGWLWLGEGFGGRRTVGATLAVAGMVLLALVGH
jgi:drug/metabolite transporter (DMT)-like permease